MEKYRDVLEAWFKKVFAGDAFEDEVARIYADYFSENEVKELIVFYKSDLSRKVTVALPQIMQKGAMVGARLGQEHAQELKDMLLEARKQREPEAGSGQ